MLIEALVRYAETYLQAELEEPAFSDQGVHYALQIFEDGSFAGIQSRFEEAKRGKKPFPRPLNVPESPVNRNTGLHPLLGCDAIHYVLGIGPWTDAGKEDNHRERHDAFVELLREAAEATRDPALRACMRFYESATAVETASASMAELNPPSSTRVVLSVIPKDPAASDAGGPIVSREAVRNWWREHHRVASADRVKKGGEGMCLVTGDIGPIAPTHDKIKHAANLGGQPSGVALMSFDKPAFRSYGWEQNANSPVSPRVAAAYVLALNDLMKLGKHRSGRTSGRFVQTRYDAGDKVAFLFWTDQPTDVDWFALLNEAQPEEIEALLSAPRRGMFPNLLEVSEFFFIAVSGNGGRLLVRTWFHDSLERVLDNIRAWFEGLRIADVFHQGQPAAPPKLWELLASISGAAGTPWERAANVPAERSVQLWRRALQGTPLGHGILAGALERFRREQGNARLAPQRVGLVRLAHNDIVTARGGEPNMQEQLNPEEQDPAYVCGRLMAVYEKLQYQAQGGKINMTVTDRYFSMASTRPLLAIKKLEDLSKAHLRKLRRENRGVAVNIGREITALIERIENFPEALNLEAQGRFIVGYHHQRASDARAAAEARSRKANLAALDGLSDA